MTNQERQQSLVLARCACLLLTEYATGDGLLILGEPQRDSIASLLEEFGRLDGIEQGQIEAGRKFGSLGGRPKKKPARRKQAAKT